MDRYIGGEFWYDNSIIDNNCNREFDGYFLSGGNASLKIICKYLLQNNISEILLPNYLCPTIIDVFNNNCIKYEFYTIKQDFTIDLEYLESIIDNYKALLFINYFGFLHRKDEISYLKSLKERSIIIIEDNVQTLINNHSMGNFHFNSFRKFVPYDGSLLYCDFDLSDIFSTLKTNNADRINVIREAREIKRQFIQLNRETTLEEKYVKLFECANDLYYNDENYLIDEQEKKYIKMLKYDRIKEIRYNNYNYMLNFIKQDKVLSQNLSIIFDKVENDTTLLCFPIYLDNKIKREKLRKELANNKIFLPIHWSFNDLKLQDEMSYKIISLIIDQRYNEKDMEYQLESIKKILSKI